MVSFLLAIQIILASIISAASSSSSNRVAFTSNVIFNANGSVSMAVAGMSEPELLPNGKYDESVVLAGISVFRTYLEQKAVSKYTTCHHTERIYTYATGKIFSIMNDVDTDILLPDMIKLMAQEYAEMAKSVCRRISAPVDQEEVELVKKKAMILAVFIHELISNGYEFTEEQNLVFLEFIYRFSPGGIRYILAFQCLYACLDNESLLFVYDLIVKYFDPENPALPVFFLKFQTGDNVQIKIAFINFLERLYEKLMELDPVLKADQINRHANMLISSMISCNFIEDFDHMLFDLLQKVDLNKLLCSTRFSKSASHVIKQSLQTSKIAVFFSDIFVNNSFILALDESNFLNYGAFLNHLNSESYIARLSTEASTRLLEIRFKFISYSKIIVTGHRMLETIEDNFVRMNKSELDELNSLIESQISNSNDFFSCHRSVADNFNSRLIKIVPKLVLLANANKDSSAELNLERYKILVKLLELVLSIPAALDEAPDSFSNVLFFYNCFVSKVPNANTLLADYHALTLELIHKLISKNRFFYNNKHKKILNSYLQLTRSNEADTILSDILLHYLRAKPSKQTALAEVFGYATKFQIFLNPVFSIYIFTEIQKYFDSSPKIPIETYEDGLLVEISNVIIAFKVLSKTEQLFVKSFCNQFSADRNIFTE